MKSSFFCLRVLGFRRSPCGERGLKFFAIASNAAYFASLPVRGAWIEIALHCSVSVAIGVAPRAGSVD